MLQMSPLHVAAERGCFTVVKYLVDQEVDINDQDHNGVSECWYRQSGTTDLISLYNAEHLSILGLKIAPGQARTWPGTCLAGHVPGQSTMFVPLMSCKAHASTEANGLGYSRCPANTNDLATPLLQSQSIFEAHALTNTV